LILEAHLDNISTSEPLILLEVGGGYGRLAELFLRYSSLPISYLLVDGVPEFVYYSWEYLRQRLPDHRIGIYFNHQHFDPARFDAYVLPAWRAKEVLSHPVHGAINVASIREMPDKLAENDYLAKDAKEAGKSACMTVNRGCSIPQRGLSESTTRAPLSGTDVAAVLDWRASAMAAVNAHVLTSTTASSRNATHGRS
jgi:hypothetical protein